MILAIEKVCDRTVLIQHPEIIRSNCTKRSGPGKIFKVKCTRVDDREVDRLDHEFRMKRYPEHVQIEFSNRKVRDDAGSFDLIQTQSHVAALGVSEGMRKEEKCGEKSFMRSELSGLGSVRVGERAFYRRQNRTITHFGSE
jgi:hypothetical protein